MKKNTNRIYFVSRRPIKQSEYCMLKTFLSIHDTVKAACVSMVGFNVNHPKSACFVYSAMVNIEDVFEAFNKNSHGIFKYTDAKCIVAYPKVKG